MSRRAGLTLGKFHPLHKGHELLLETALANSHHLRILIGVAPEDTIPYDIRRRWIEEFAGNLIRGSNKTIEIHPDPSVAKAGHGTVIDESYWERWIGQNHPHLATTDMVFTSDRYGPEIASRTATRWFPVDPDRDLFRISATDILGNLRTNWHHLSDVAKPDLALTIAIVGAESTGKSVLTARLARAFDTTYAPEWGRILSEAKPDLDSADFSDIVEMQLAFIRKAQIHGNGLCFTDTEAITTALFAPIYLQHEHPLAEQACREQRLNLYIVLAPTVPHILDGTRVLDQSGRALFHRQLLERLETLGRKFVVVEQEDFEARYHRARDAVADLLGRESGS